MSFIAPNKMIAHIKIITIDDADNTRTEDVWLDCEVTDKQHQERLNLLQDLMRSRRVLD